MAKRRQTQPEPGEWLHDRSAWGVALPDDLDWLVVDGQHYRFAIYGSTRQGFVQVGDFWLLPESWAFIDEGAAVPAASRAAIPGVVLHLRLEGGHQVVQSLTLVTRPGGLPITTGSYRKINVASLLELVSRHTALKHDAGELKRPSFEDADQLLTRLEENRRSTAPGRGGRQSDEHLQIVADKYRAAAAVSRSPTKEVARQMNTARSNAGRWVMEARRRGFLGTTKPGQSGEKGGQ